MSAATLVLLTLLVQADPPESPKQEALSVETDGYLRASDLGIEKWTVNATIGGESVLSIIQVIRRDGDNERIRATEIVEYSAMQEKHHEDILIIDQSLFGDSRYIRVKSPEGVTRYYERSAGDSTSAYRRSVKNAEIQHVGTFVISNGDGEKTRIMFFTRLAELKDYPKLQELLEGSQLVGTSYVQEVTKLPNGIDEFLK